MDVEKTLKIVAISMVILLCIYGLLFYQNNRAAEPVRNERIAQSYEHGVSWLLNHRQDILREPNTALWWMLRESARVSGDVRIQSLVDEFLKNFDVVDSYSIWQAYFHPRAFRNAVFSPSEYTSLVDYQQHFLYALTCSNQLASEPLIRTQNNNPDFCWHGARAVRPACVTHQLMAYEMIRRRGCYVENLDSKISILQNTIEKQLTYDPRVVDVYIQRVLMLVDSGARERIKPRWLERVLDAQLEDGGWSDMQPLIPAGGGKYVGFDARAVKIATPISNFHATAQGVLLMTLLRHP